MGVIVAWLKRRFAIHEILSGLVIGSAIIMTVQGGTEIFGVPILGAIGFMGYALAFVNSAWVIYGIWRSTKK